MPPDVVVGLGVSLYLCGKGAPVSLPASKAATVEGKGTEERNSGSGSGGDSGDGGVLGPHYVVLAASLGSIVGGEVGAALAELAEAYGEDGADEERVSAAGKALLAAMGLAEAA